MHEFGICVNICLHIAKDDQVLTKQKKSWEKILSMETSGFTLKLRFLKKIIFFAFWVFHKTVRFAKGK